MTAPEFYQPWAKRHATSFMLSPDWIRAAMEWWPTFAEMRTTASELNEATAMMRREVEPGLFNVDHLAKVRISIYAQRRAKREAAQKPDDVGIIFEPASPEDAELCRTMIRNHIDRWTKPLEQNRL